MQSFRTEIENPVVEKDILELERKIHEFHEGKLDEEKFRRSSFGKRSLWSAPRRCANDPYKITIWKSIL